MLLTRSSGLLLLLLAGRAGYSQKIVPGYIVTAGQDSLRGAIAIHDDEVQQKQVDFITAQGNQRQLLDARAVRAYGYTTDKDTVRYVAVSMNLGRTKDKTEQLFLRQLIGGPVGLFQYRYSRGYSAQPSRISTEVIQVPTTSSSGKTTYTPVTRSYFSNPPARSQAFPPLTKASALSGTGVSLLLYRQGQRGFVEATSWRFPADAVAYFADCPALASDLQAKRYHARNLPQLVRRYNGCQSIGH